MLDGHAVVHLLNAAALKTVHDQSRVAGVPRDSYRQSPRRPLSLGAHRHKRGITATPSEPSRRLAYATVSGGSTCCFDVTVGT